MYSTIVVDANSSSRLMICSLLGATGEFQVVDETAENDEGVRMIRELMPNLVVVNLNCPHISGLNLIESIKLDVSKTRFLILSEQSDAIWIARSMSSGAHGFLEKKEAWETKLLPIGRILLAGYSVFPESGVNLWRG